MLFFLLCSEVENIYLAPGVKQILNLASTAALLAFQMLAHPLIECFLHFTTSQLHFTGWRHRWDKLLWANMEEHQEGEAARCNNN